MFCGVHSPPADVSFDVTPVAYYGAQFSRDDGNIDTQIVTLMQEDQEEDGPCWTIYCPAVARTLAHSPC